MRGLLILEKAAWGVGLLLIAVFAIARMHGAVSSRAELARFEAARAAHSGAAQPPADTGAPLPVPTSVDFSLWSESRVRAYRESQKEPAPLAIAVLEVPRLHLAVPVLEGTDELTLNRGVGHVEGTARPGDPGNVAIAGHRDGFFRVLKDVTSGDRIRLVTLGQTLEYTVQETRIVEPEDVQVLELTGTPVLTLLTCYPFYYVGSAPKRFVVRAVLLAEGR
jgi:sortase A